MPPNKKLKEYRQFKSNPNLALFQALEEIKKRNKEDIKSIKDDLLNTIERQIKKASLEVKQQNLVNAGFIEKIVAKITADLVKDTKGDKGEKGDKGNKGEEFVGSQGKQGIQGEQGDQGKQGEKGLKGLRGLSGEKGERGLQGIPGLPGKDGKDGSPDTPKQIKIKLEKLKGEARLDASAIKNLPIAMGRGKTLHRGGYSISWNELLGVGDNNTTVFTFDKKPHSTSDILVWVGGGSMFLTDDYTISGRTITFITAPPTNAKVRATYRYT